jgi:hypothetical protein
MSLLLAHPGRAVGKSLALMLAVSAFDTDAAETQACTRGSLKLATTPSPACPCDCRAKQHMPNANTRVQRQLPIRCHYTVVNYYGVVVNICLSERICCSAVRWCKELERKGSELVTVKTISEPWCM